ncbi:MAG: hypothetical protein HUU22_18270 [Phycisphaerae bacterium]|nr:hypothetical protein [Phycisphaerae bacterium]NUQ47963.1 hypothetical protein [Phycisphaerae bacterium]
MREKFLWLAAVIAAHPDQKVVGRTRLQKTIKLLQRLGAPMDYDYMIHFYGPYSEGVQSDIGLLEAFGFVEEDKCSNQEGAAYFILKATDAATKLACRPEVSKFHSAIRTMSETDPIVLELAATYDAFRDMGHDHKSAIERLRRKKGVKCEQGRAEQALELLKKLGLRDA